jgi:hypothetical protein
VIENMINHCWKQAFMGGYNGDPNLKLSPQMKDGPFVFPSQKRAI